MDQRDIAMAVAAGVLFASFLMWLVRFFLMRWHSKKSVSGLAIGGAAVVLCAWIVGATVF